ncbi:MAG: hypothetical protein IPI55_16905 [Flavobacteriales bacterium]|nr:hypothetical protein [Flavobacteriales bacterium]
MLIATKNTEEALLQARRLREQGLLNPALTRQLGDLLARQGLLEEAQRTYSEIVEFDAGSPASRALLGDVYLAHGWYQAAYTQYRTLTDANAQDFTAVLKLASAAAGEGRVDEAFRLERRVAESEGTPGPDDPRRWARLWSAARLARLLVNPPKDEGDPKKLAESLNRRLKELQLFQGPGALVLVTWEDLNADVAVGINGKAAEGTGGESVDANRVGLAGVALPANHTNVALEATLRSGKKQDAVKMLRHDITFDGKSFKVDVHAVELAAGKSTVSL